MFSIFFGFKTLVQKIIFLFLLRVIEMLLLSTMAQMGIIVGTVCIGSKKSGSTIPCFVWPAFYVMRNISCVLSFTFLLFTFNF